MEITALLLLVLGAAAQRSRLNHQPLRQDFTVNRLSAHRNVMPPAELRVTDNVLSLRREPASSLSAVYLQTLRRRMGGVSRAVGGNTTLISVESGNVFLANITVGGQEFSVVIDTGSSDPWLAVNDFECHDASTDERIASDECGFGPTYNPLISSSFTDVPNQNFNISYADGEYLTGDVGYESMTMAGVTVPRQQFGLVNTAAWFGDGVSSGLIGFSYSTLTSAYAGDDPLQDVPGRTLRYNPLFVNMYEQSGIPPVFSLAMSRNGSEGGILAIGGIPDIPSSKPFYNATILPIGINASSGALVYQYYSIRLTGFAVAQNSTTRFNFIQGLNPTSTDIIGNNTEAIVDSGTSIIYVPDTVASAVAAQFTPPASYDEELGFYTVDCDAQAPFFGVVISKKIYAINEVDLISPLSRTRCVSTVQSNDGGLSILGDTFFKNMLVVFDVGAQQMRFAARPHTGLQWDRPRGPRS